MANRFPSRSSSVARERVDSLRRQRRIGNGDRSHEGSGGLATLIRVLGVLLFIVLIAAAGGLLTLERAYAGRIFANIAVQGVPLGEQTPAEARTILRAHYNELLTTPVTFVFNDRTWQPSAAEIGLSLDTDATVAQAYAVGRGANLLQSIPEAVAVWRNGLDLSPQLVLDQRKLAAYLVNVASTLEAPSQSASISIAQGRVFSTTAQVGQQVLIGDAVAQVLASLPLLQPQTVTLHTRELRPQIEDAGVAPIYAQLSTLLSAPMILQAGERQWEVTPQELGGLVQFSTLPRSDGPGQIVTATLNLAPLEQRLQTIATELDATPVEPRLRFTTNGLQIIRDGRDGARLEVAQAREQLAAAVWQPERVLPLPVTVLQPQVRPDTLASLGIVELVGQGKSSFEASAAYRITNIQAGANQMDGVVIAPGEEFSFNRTVGAIDETNGFTKGYAIIDGRTQLEWGGGVCQVSTTVFRAAYWAGVPLTERNQHSFRISWYEKYEPIGMDAAIFNAPGGYDLRWVNDTDNWLLMEAVADTTNEVLTINLYGTSPGREVIQVPPVITNEVPTPTEPKYFDDPALPAGTVKQTDTARGGMDVTVGRIVKKDGVVLFEDSFFSRFKAWPNIFVRGTG